MHICCMKCKEHLWIGQTDTLYWADESVMEALNEFLVKHRTYSPKEHDPNNYHELLYMPEPYNGSFENIEWVEIEPNPSPKKK